MILTVGLYFFIDFGRWFFCLDMIDSHLTFCVDSLSLICSSLVSLLTMLALYFGVEYMYREAFINRLLYLLNLFATSVILLFYCYDYFLILFMWECIGLFSLLLVNFYSSRIYTLKASLKTFIFSRVSDMFMFFTFLLVINTFSSTDLSLIFIQIPFLTFHYIFISGVAFHFLTIFSLCLAMSGTIKAAQFFSHVWLPDAMEAPTPASALIHSSTLVIAGIFLILRFSVLFEFTIFTNCYLVILGSITLAFGAITATFQTDIKKLVAYSTISQIGYLVCGCGFSCYEEVLIYLVIHALNKAFLFILVGYIVHFFSGNTDMRQMGGMYLYSFDMSILLFGVCFNLAGLPYSAGFFGKEFLLFQVLRDDYISLIIRSCWIVGFFFTPIYTFTLVFLILFDVKKGSIISYKLNWESNFISQLFISYQKSRQCLSSFKSRTTQQRVHYLIYKLQRFHTSRYIFTSITSRFTTYLLVLFWLFFFFFGESLLLITFNFSSVIDTITSSSFFTFKQHAIFFINTASLKLNTHLFIYILCMTLFSFTYLFNLSYSCNYYYFKQNNTILFLIFSFIFLFILI